MQDIIIIMYCLNGNMQFIQNDEVSSPFYSDVLQNRNVSQDFWLIFLVLELESRAKIIRCM